LLNTPRHKAEAIGGNMPAHRKGKEVRRIVAIRLDPSEKELLIKHFGGVQAAIDSILNKLKK